MLFHKTLRLTRTLFAVLLLLFTLATACTADEEPLLDPTFDVTPSATATTPAEFPTPNRSTEIPPTETPLPTAISLLPTATLEQEEQATVAPTEEPTSVPVSRGGIRPIPTSSAPPVTRTATTTPTKTLSETVDVRPVIDSAQPPAAPVARAPLTTNNTPPANRAEFSANLTNAHAQLNTLVDVIHRANWQGTLYCADVIAYYRVFVLEFSNYDIDAAFAVPFGQQRNAVEVVRSGIGPLRDFCQNREGAEISAWQISPQSLYTTAYARGTEAIHIMDDALAWLSGDPLQLAVLFGDTRLAMASYGTLINNAAVRHCRSIVTEYEKVVFESPKLSPGSGAAQTSYNHYVNAIRAIEQGGSAIYHFCNTALANGEPPQTPVPAETIRAAVDGYNTALYELGLAGASLSEFPSSQSGNAQPQQDGSTLEATVLRVQPSEQSHLYEVVVQVEVNGGTPPFTVVIGGFTLADDNTITIVHTCERDFQDRVTLRDAKGVVYQSEILWAKRADSCRES